MGCGTSLTKGEVDSREGESSTETNAFHFILKSPHGSFSLNLEERLGILRQLTAFSWFL
jgi:hypothetical protein